MSSDGFSTASAHRRRRSAAEVARARWRRLKGSGRQARPGGGAGRRRSGERGVRRAPRARRARRPACIGRRIRLPAETSEAELLATVDRLNADPEIHGILVQMPLPKQIDSEKVLQRIDPAKDVDGFHPVNVGKLRDGRQDGVRAVHAVRRAADADPHTAIETQGRQRGDRRAASNIVGKPMAKLLIQQGPGGDATVTVCHSRTRDLPAVTRTRRHPDRRDREGGVRHRRHGAARRGGDRRRHQSGRRRVAAKGYRLVGDVAYDPVAEIASAITPVPGGVGPMTIAMLLQNTLQAMQQMPELD